MNILNIKDIKDKVRLDPLEISLNNNKSNKLVIFLCNPASKNGITNEKEDYTIRWIKNNLNLTEYKSFIILNIISSIEKNLENIKISNELTINDINYYHNINKEKINNVLLTNNISTILFACGQHFIQSKCKHMSKYYKDFFIDIYNILYQYKNILYCLEYTKKCILIGNKNIKLPYFPSNRKKKNMTLDNNNKIKLKKYNYI